MNASEGGITQHLIDLVGRELRDCDLVGIDAGFLQDHAEQLYVDLGCVRWTPTRWPGKSSRVLIFLASLCGPLRGGSGGCPTAPRRSCAGSRPTFVPSGMSSSARAPPRGRPCRRRAPLCSPTRARRPSAPKAAPSSGRAREAPCQRLDQLLVIAARGGRRRSAKVVGRSRKKRRADNGREETGVRRPAAGMASSSASGAEWVVSAASFRGL